MTMDKVYHQNRSSGFTSTVTTLNRPIYTNGLNGSVGSLVSRLPQRRESKIPGPHNQPTSPGLGCSFNGISSSSSSIQSSSCQPPPPSSSSTSTTITTTTSNCTPTISPPKKFLNPPNKLLSTQGTGLLPNRTDSSLRSVSPTTVYKCKSTQSHLTVPSPTVTTGSTLASSSHSPSMCNINSSVQSNPNDTNRGIRPPRLTPMSTNILPTNGSMLTTPTGKSIVTVNRSQITRHSAVNNGFATVGRSGSSMQNHHRSLTLREVKEDEAPRRSKTPSSSSSGQVRGLNPNNSNHSNNNSPRPTTGSLTSSLNANRSDSTSSLNENDSGSERKTLIINNKSLTRTNLTKGLVGGTHGIPLPKSRPNSVCLDNSPMTGSSTVITSSSSTTTVSHKTPSMSSVNGTSLSKGINKSGLRPLSSSGIPKTGFSGNRSSVLNSKMNEESPKSEATAIERGRRATVESHLVPTRSEPNVARVSPIRRSIGQNVNGDSGSSVRLGTGLKEEESNPHLNHHQKPKQQHPQYDDKMDNYSSSGLTGCSVSSTIPSSSSSNVTSSVMVPTSTSPSKPLSPISSSLSSLSSVSSPSTSIITSTSTSVSTVTVTTPTSFNPPLIPHQLPLGLSSVSRASEPMLPILSSTSQSNQQNSSSLKSVVEESLPVKARSTLSLSSQVNPLHENKDVHPRAKKIDLSGNVLSFLESTKSISSSSCDLINSNGTLNGDSRSLSSTSTTHFSSNLSEPSPTHSNGYMSPVLEDDCPSPNSRQSTDSPIDSPFNQTIIDRTKFSTNHNLPTINGNNSSQGNPHDSDFLRENELATINNNLNETLISTNTVPSTNNLLNKINRCIKCTLPSEAEFNLKTDLRFTSNSNSNGLTGCGSIVELTSYGVNGCGNLMLPTTPPPLSTNLQSSSTASQQQLPPPPLLLQSNGLGSSSLTNQIKRLSKNGELRGSTISLLSGSSSFSATEERHNQEVKKLRDDLNRANSKVETLTQQLKNSNDMTQTFGKILETLRSRLYQCSLATDQKDREIGRLKTTIEVLRRECANANGETNGVGGGNPSCYGSSSDIECRRDKNKKRSHKEPRSPSCDRDIINSGDSSGPSGWFKGSIQRAFKKNRSRNKSGGSMSDVEVTISKSNHASDSASLPSTPLTLNNNTCINNKTDPFVELNSINGTTINTNGSADLIIKDEDGLIKDLKKQLREKEKQLNDIRLEVLLTASQTESLNDRISKMTKEMSLLRSENHRLQCLLLRQSSIG